MKGLLGALCALVLAVPLQAQLGGTYLQTGNPEDAQTGAQWTFKDTVDGVVYDLAGILFKPVGNGPFPGVVISHGTGGNALIYSRNAGREMAKWGYAVIGVNYTHSGNVACGSPGNCADQMDWGASRANIQRGMKAWQILATRSYVDSNNIMAFGHSRGAFVTTALASEASARFKAVAHTAGGVVPDIVPGSAPHDSMARKIRVPYLLSHGDADTTAPLILDRRLDSVLASIPLEHRLDVYPGYDHAMIASDTVMYRKTREWFEGHRNTSAIRLPARPVSTRFPTWLRPRDWLGRKLRG